MVPYDSFQSLNSKTGSMTLQECWGRMLLTVRGMSAEKVAFVIGDANGDGYETPRKLYEAFKKDEVRERREVRERERENAVSNGTSAAENGKGKGRKKLKRVRPARELLCDLGGSGRAKIGPALSGQVYDLLMGSY